MTEINHKSANVPEKLLSRIWRISYSSLASVKLAIALLIIILVCCVAGVTVVRGQQAGAMIFGTIWFNGLLVALVVNVAFCFFGRIWGRKVTLISFGMIVFHLSFVAMFAGIIYNSFFYFRGSIRLTEGEVLPSGEPLSYDHIERGRYFDMEKLNGETSLVRMHTGYDVEGAYKGPAYEITVGEGREKKRDIIYITKKLDHNGFQYINDREGYSLLIKLFDGRGRELYGAYVPLQSFKKKDGTYYYSTGTKDAPDVAPFPQEPLKPVFALLVAYHPSSLKGKEREGEASFQAWGLRQKESAASDEKPFAEGKTLVGKMVRIGNHFISADEVRYWVAMNVRYEPGKPIVLASLWVGLSGLILTFIGKMMKIRAQ